MAPKKIKSKKQRKQPRKSNNKNRHGSDAPVSRASKPLRSNASGSTRQSGIDHVATTDTGTVETGSVITRIQILPSICRRLDELANAFQRIRYRRLHFRIEPMGGTAVTGGYAAAFIRDPADIISKESALSTIMAQKGSVSRKAWEGCNLLFSSGQRFYTSANDELRTFCPGELVIVCTAKFSQPVNFVISMTWTVDLEDPGLQDQIEENLKPLGHPKEGWVIGLRKGHSGIWGRKRSDSTWVYNLSEIIDYPFPPPASVDSKTVVRFRAKFPLVYEEKEDSEYAFRDIVCMIASNSWEAYPCEPDSKATGYYSTSSVHSVPWLTAVDELEVVNADGGYSAPIDQTVATLSGEDNAELPPTTAAAPPAPISQVVTSHWRQNRHVSSRVLAAARNLLTKDFPQQSIYSALGFTPLPTLTVPTSRPSDESPAKSTATGNPPTPAKA